MSADVVDEDADEGTDRVNASVSYVLGADVENLTLTGAAAINGTGNALDNDINGNWRPTSSSAAAATTPSMATTAPT